MIGSFSLTRSIPALVFVLICLSNFEAQATHTFSGIDLRNGAETSIVREDASTKGTVLIFLSSKCPCSASHMGEIKNLAKDYPEFRFIGVNSNTDESLESAKAFFAAQGLSFPILRDEKTQIADEFKAVKTPHAFILAANGKKLFQGGVSDSASFPRADRKYLREALEDIKHDLPVRTPLARALGCAIVRGD
jgi:peroxiredoxin